MRTASLALCLLTASSGAALTQAPPSQVTQFRAGVDLLRIDVTVLDKRTRKPVRRLKAEDFEVKVGGVAQPLQAVAEIETRARTTSGSEWQTSAGRDVVANDISPTRLIVIVMDDAGGMWHRQAGKKVAHKIIDGMGPDDLAAIVFVNKTDRSQDLTADRSLLRAAADSFDPLANPRWAAPDAAGTVRNVRGFLAKLAKYRRAIMVVTSQGAPGGNTGWGWLENAGLKDEDPDAMSSSSVVAASRLGHVPIYFFTTFGLTLSTNPTARHAGEHVRALAQRSGGRAIVENNEPETEVAAVLDELTSIYTLAYAPTFPFDGRSRFADIRVNRPDVLVLPSSGAFRTARDDASAPARVNVTKGFSLLDAVAAPLMGGTLPLKLAATAIAVTGAKEHAVAVTLGLPAPGAGVSAKRYAVSMLVYDGEGRQEISNTRKDIAITPAEGTADAPAEVIFRLDLRPGRYNIRLGVEPEGGGQAGSVFSSIDIPDFAKDPFSVSGVAIGRAEGRPIGGREAFSTLLPFAPTTVREFSSSDHVGALIRVHQATGRAVTLRVETQIVDSGGTVLVSESTPLHASAFIEGRGVEHRYELPLRTLSPGEYLLRFVADASERRATREVRFSIR